MLENENKEEKIVAVYAGIVKSRTWDNEPWNLCAAFKEVRKNGSERLLFCGQGAGLDPESIQEVGSIAAFFNLCEEQALIGIKAIERTQRDIASRAIELDSILSWDDLSVDDRIGALYKPNLDL